MAHTPQEAQDFASRMGKLAQPMIEVSKTLQEVYWLDQPFVTGEESISDDDFAGSSYEGLSATLPVEAFAMIESWMTTNRAALVGLAKFK